MKPRYRRLDPRYIIETIVETLLSDGADLRVVTLDEFKGRLKQTIHSIVDESNAT